MKLENKSLFIVPLLLIVALGILLQNLIFLPGDVGFLTYLAKSLPQGATYGKDYLETNPPLILYFYYPVWIITRLTLLPVITAIQLYIFSWLIMMMIFSYYILQKIIRENFSLCLIFTTLLIVTFILPVHIFGQREHLYFALTLPYFLCVVLRIENKPLHVLPAFFIGLVAGIGFDFKPFFFVPFILVEVFFMIYARSFWTWVRVETIVIGLVAIVYLLSIFVFHPSYIHLMLPLVSKLYFVGVRESLNEILFMPDMFFIFAVGLIYVFFKTARYRLLSQILMLVLIGDIIIYLLGQTSWYYHLLPSVSIACLLLSLYFGEWMETRSTSALIFYLCVLSFSFFIPLHYAYQITEYFSAQKKSGSLVEVTHYIKNQPGTHSVMCFSVNTTGNCFPLVYETDSTYSSRYPFIWWFRGLVKLGDKYPKVDAEYLLNTIAEDMVHFKPRWVIMDVSIPHYLYGTNFSLVNYFEQNKNFDLEWKHYHLKMRADDYYIYERA